MGRALRDGYRDKVQLATKLPVWLVQEAEGLGTPAGRAAQEAGHGPHRFLPAARPQRRPLGDRAPPQGPGAPWSGPRPTGASATWASPSTTPCKVFKPIIDGYDWEFCQIQFNFIDAGFQAGIEGLNHAAARGVGAIAMEPLRGGTLAWEQPPDVQAIWARTAELRPPAEWALRWVWNHRSGGDRPFRDERPRPAGRKPGRRRPGPGRRAGCQGPDPGGRSAQPVRRAHAGSLHHLRLLRPVPQRRGHSGSVQQLQHRFHVRQLAGRRRRLPDVRGRARPRRRPVPSLRRPANPSAPSRSPSWKS